MEGANCFGNGKKSKEHEMLKAIFIGSVVLMLASNTLGANDPSKKAIKKGPFGNVDGKEVFLYALKNSKGMEVKITNYGGIVVSLKTPDKDGNLADIVLGYDSLSG